MSRYGRFDLIFYLAGADPFRHDRLGRLDLTVQGLQRRDRTVFDWARQPRASGGRGNGRRLCPAGPGYRDHPCQYV